MGNLLSGMGGGVDPQALSQYLAQVSPTATFTLTLTLTLALTLTTLTLARRAAWAAEPRSNCSSSCSSSRRSSRRSSRAIPAACRIRSVVRVSQPSP